jgi:hypothetical protein
MCNLHSLNEPRNPLAAIFGVSHNCSAVFEPVNAIFPRHVAPVVRNAPGGEREIVTMNLRWLKCADRWVLTAAHCFHSSTKGAEARAKAGATNYSTQGTWSDIERIIIHENCNSKTNEHDLALVGLGTHPLGQIIPLASHPV